MYEYEIKIPRERIAVLIGVKGQIKRQIEEATKSRLKVDSEEGDVFVSGDDSIGLMTARDIVKAIGRGFNPEVAMRLLKQDYSFESVDMTDFARNVKDIPRVRGRVIGTKGKSRKKIEELTQTSISVYGKTVGIIGQIEKVDLAKQAIESLLNGSPHSKVYLKLERKNKEDFRREILGTKRREEDG
jgi:ribosomal RNA assembly protein